MINWKIKVGNVLSPLVGIPKQIACPLCLNVSVSSVFIVMVHLGSRTPFVRGV